MSPLGDQRPAEEDQANLPEELAVNSKRELLLRHGLERAEMRLAGRACERVEAPDLVGTWTARSLAS